MDAFYASVEQADNPEYRGKPVIIGALPGHRGVVAACSYEAREYGVHSAMPVSHAYRLCKNGIYLPPRMERYQEVSKQIMDIFNDYSPEVQQISIDEAFINMTGTERLFGPPEKSAASLKKQVKDITGQIISVGIAPNKYLAKIASDFDKPDGLYRVFPGKEEEFLDRIKLKDLWGLGEKTLTRLEELNITTIPKLRALPEGTLVRFLGKAGASYLYRAVRGIDPGIYRSDPKSHSISSETTFPADTRDKEVINRALLDIAHQVMYRSSNENMMSKTLVCKIRFADFSTTTVQQTCQHYLTSAEELYDLARKLLRKRWDGSREVRLIGLGLSSLEKGSIPRQRDLFSDEYDRKKQVEQAVFEMKKKKWPAVIRASLLKKTRNGRNSSRKDEDSQTDLSI